MVLGHFGWFWVVLGGFGWFHVLVTTIFQCISWLFESYEWLQEIDLHLFTDENLNGHPVGRKIAPHW